MARQNKRTLSLARGLAKQLLSSLEEPKTTVDELFTLLWNDHWSKPQYVESGWSKTVKGYYLKNVFPKFGNSLLHNVTQKDVRDWHQSLIQTPISANRSLEILSRLFTHANQSSLSTQNPCNGIKAFPEKRRSRYASEEEIKKICELLNKEMPENPWPCIFIYTLLYTGARPRSLERATWDQLQRTPEGLGVLTFKGKSTATTGEDEVVHIPKNIMEMIDANSHFKRGLIFGIKLPRNLWEKIRKEAGCEDLRARDLRRTFATIAMSAGESMETISELLNHRSTQTTKIYAKLNPKKRTDTVSVVSAAIGNLVK